MNELVARLTAKNVTDAIDQLAPPFKTLPHLPKEVTDFLVMVSPWLAGLGGIFSALFGVRSISFGLGLESNALLDLIGITPTFFIVNGIIQLMMAAVLLLAFKPLQEKQKTGWILLFWSVALSVVQSLTSIVFGGDMSTLLFTLLMIAVSLYLLFELRSAYH